VVLEVRRLAAVGLRDRLQVVRPAPSRLEDEPPDLRVRHLEDLRVAVRELADLVRLSEVPMLGLLHLDPLLPLSWVEAYPYLLVGQESSSDTKETARAMGTTQVDTATQILDAAERLVQERGFNGFSYADVARELGVTKAALHYHFPGKAELGDALIERYARRFGEALVAVDERDIDAADKLRAYAQLYAAVFSDDRMCLCGMLAADYATLPQPMRDRVVRFFDDNEVWLARVLEEGRTEGNLRFQGSARSVARTIVGGLEGAMLVARPYGDIKRFRSAASLLIDGLAVER
jgi:TetR/AcrR family transcriptional repressor of nem operon